MLPGKRFYHFCTFCFSGRDWKQRRLLLGCHCYCSTAFFEADGTELNREWAQHLQAKKTKQTCMFSLSDWPFLTAITTATERANRNNKNSKINLFFDDMTGCPMGLHLLYTFEDRISNAFKSLYKIMLRGLVVLAVISLLLAMKGNLANKRWKFRA